MRTMILARFEKIAMTIVAQLSQGGAFDEAWRTPSDAPWRISEN
jgi:hypothetical protein